MISFSFRSLLSFSLLASWLFVTAQAANACYFPSNAIASNYIPCSPTGDGGCCLDGDFCTGLGYCVSNSQGYHYRGACTDSTWGNPSCPKYCLTNENSGNSSAVNVIACDAASTSGTWCCAYSGNFCLEPSNVYIPSFGTLFVEPGAATTSSSATGVSSPTSTSASVTSSSTTIVSSGSITPSPKSNSSNKDTVVGAAVGVPLGLLALMGVVLFLIERRKRMNAQSSTLLPGRENQYQDNHESRVQTVDGEGRSYYSANSQGRAVDERPPVPVRKDTRHALNGYKPHEMSAVNVHELETNIGQ